ncbi:GntR family transcriptional regulator [Gordonia soli]|uniref:Putative GntR family transcriptional regulator n=1 Tax=Gordonia soli NBRC 108243 TaxID=1223545 RepID=M0QG71_9ACTN|nr:GntR family transcriptional regulator [Gordonia soli]GAC67583.1 putative GntR family transcriptional regulator [Gordonia soli NBRC 108243]
MSKESSAAERVYQEVKDLILTSRLPGGELVSEGEIATRCSVSRTPVREAFLRLETEGWMRLYPKRGALVVPIADREARDVLDARLLLEIHAVERVVVDHLSVATLGTALRANLAAHRAADRADLGEFTRLDLEFHQLIVAAADNPLLSDFYQGLGERHRRMVTASVRRDDQVTDRILADHTELAELIEDLDARRFGTRLARHMTEVHAVPGTSGDRRSAGEDA